MTTTPTPGASMTTTQSVVVPLLPTEAMLDRAAEVCGQNFRNVATDTTELIWSAMLAAAPAPSSLAGGEDERATYLRANLDAVLRAVADMAKVGIEVAKQGSSYHTESRDRARIEFVEEVCRRWAALSPEAPARKKGPGGYLVKDFADGWYWTPNAALDHASGAPVWSVSDARYETDPPALTPRHEAPVVYGKGDVPLSVGDRVRVHTGEEGVIHQFLAGQTKCVNVLIRPGHGGSFFGFECEKVEAPAEGAGEDSPITAAIRAKLATVKATDYHPGTPAERMKEGKLDGLNTALAIAMVEDERAIRARSSAPEAREGELAGYANAEFMRRLKNWREAVPNTIRSDETFLKAVASESYPLALYTHPAAPSADKLRIMAERIIEQVKRGASGSGVQALGALSDIEQIALAALKAEGA